MGLDRMALESIDGFGLEAEAEAEAVGLGLEAEAEVCLGLKAI